MLEAPATPIPARTSSVGEKFSTGDAGAGYAPLRWSTCRSRFLRNLAVLHARDPKLPDIDAIWSNAEKDFELYRLADGNFLVAVVDASGRRRWWPTLADHRGNESARSFSHDPKAHQPAPYLFFGLGYGWYVRRVYEATRHTFLQFSSALFVIESHPVALAISLHLHDWQEFLSDPRVHVFVGPKAARALELSLLKDADLPAPEHCARSITHSAVEFQDIVSMARRISDRRRRMEARSHRRVSSHYQGRDAEFWARRFTDALSGAGQPLRILSATSRHTTYLQYSMRDAADAFRSLGHSCNVLIEPSDHHVITPETCHRAMKTMDADLYFILDHLRADHGRYLPLHLPMLTWDQDLLSHVFTRENIARMGPFDVIVGQSTPHYTHDLGVPANRFMSAIIPTHPGTYSHEPIAPDEFDRYACDVSYVSNASQTPADFHAEERQRMDDDSGGRLLDRMYALAVEFAAAGGLVCGASGAWILEQAQADTGVAVRNPQLRDRLRTWYLWRLGDRFFRHQALEWVRIWASQTRRSFHLYGRGWDQHPTLHPYARGVAQNGHELRCIYQASRINLQLMPAGFLHQRSMDGLAAGGFFLTRRSMADYTSVSAQRLLQVLDRREATNDALLRAIEAHRVNSGYRCDPDKPDDVALLRWAAQQERAGVIMPGFSEIVFENAEGFAVAAEHALADASRRQIITAAMRAQVLERYTYEHTMRRFLEFMRDTLIQTASGRPPACERVS